MGPTLDNAASSHMIIRKLSEVGRKKYVPAVSLASSSLTRGLSKPYTYHTQHDKDITEQ